MKFLVVGCGSIGNRHISNLIKLNEQVVGCDVSRNIRKKIKNKYNIPVFTDIKRAFEENVLDAVLVCTPNHIHVQIAEMALKNDCHVFIEKPISDRSDGAYRLAELRDEKGKTVLVGCNLRFHPPVRYITEKVSSGTIGRLISARVQFGHYLPNWRRGSDYRKIYSAKRDRGGGVLLDGIHEVDYITSLFGKPEHIFSYNIKGSDLEIDVEDVGEILLKYKNALVEIHIDYLRHYKKRSCEIIGTEGTISWQSLGKNPELMKVTLYSSDGEVIDEIDKDVDSNLQYIEEMKHFISCIKGREKPMNTIENALQSLRIVELAKKSDKDGVSASVRMT